LKGAACARCAAPLVPGARYCVQCGKPVRSQVSNLPWYAAGALLLITVVALAYSAFRQGGDGQAAPGASLMGAPAASGGVAPPLTGTPREQADQLFNRVMTELEAGDSARASFFLPMAIMAYRQAGPLDADGLYHLSLLEAASGDYAAARATAEQILAMMPKHLLGLASAARAAAAAGDDAAARDYHERFLAAYDEEKDRPLQEYRDHSRVLPTYLEEARKALGR